MPQTPDGGWILDDSTNVGPYSRPEQKKLEEKKPETEKPEPETSEQKEGS